MTKITKSLLLTASCLMLTGIIFLFFYLNATQNKDTKIWITNSSGEVVKVTVEYANDNCPEKCKLELGQFTANETRGTAFATPSEGSFYISAKFPDGKIVISNHEYTEGWKFSSIIWKYAIEIIEPI